MQSNRNIVSSMSMSRSNVLAAETFHTQDPFPLSTNVSVKGKKGGKRGSKTKLKESEKE